MDHALGGLTKCDRNDALPLGKPLSCSEEEWHAGPTPIVDGAFQGNESLGFRFRTDALLATVSVVLAADDIVRIDRQDASKNLVLLFADGRWLERRRWLHRYEREDLEEVGHHHVAKGTGRLVERCAGTKTQRLRDVDLHMGDEVAVPDRLEEPVGEPESANVLRPFPPAKRIHPQKLLPSQDT